MSSNVQKIFNGLEFLYPENQLISQLKRTLANYPQCETALVDAFSIGQLKSKMWLIENLPSNLGLVFICAGWYGTLAHFMFERARDKFTKIRSFDIDNNCASIADTLNRSWVMDQWQFKASTLDIVDMKYPTVYKTHRSNNTSLELVEMPDTIINTSCEHIVNFSQWYENIPSGVMVILQSNNFFEIPEHINCSSSLEAFAEQTPMSLVLYQGELDLTKYKRYMRIGIK
jgi:hypothetical protein